MKRSKPIAFFLTVLMALTVYAPMSAFAYPEEDPVYITYARSNFQATDTLLNLKGSAALTGNAIRLTPASADTIGSAFFKNKISQKDGFSNFFIFNLNSQYNGGADGLVFTISSSANEYGTTGGGMGYESVDNSVGIEFDTFKNDDTDLDASHIAIDLNGVNSPYAYATQAGIDFNNTGPFYTWIDYNGSEIEVRISTTEDRPTDAALTYSLDLSEYAGTEYYVGFTAATGGSSQEHQIAGWYFDNKYWSAGLRANGNYLTDSTPPTAPTIRGSSNGRISLSGSVDEESGVDHYEYKIADGEWISGSSFRATDIDEGTEIFGRAIDVAGNISDTTTYSYVTIRSHTATPLPVAKMVLEFNIGDTDSFLTAGEVNRQLLPMDVKPIIYEDRTLLPIRFVVEPLGGTIVWNKTEKKVTITRGDTIIELWIGKNIAKVNGVEKMIDPDNPKVMPLLFNPGRTMLPLRFISEALGCTVEWDALTQQITVSEW